MRHIPLRGPLLLLALIGCEKESLISATSYLDPPLTTAMLTVTVTDGDRGYTWQGSDFAPSDDNATPHSQETELARLGPDLVVSFRLEDGGQVLSQGTITLPRRNDWRWSVGSITAPQIRSVSASGASARRPFRWT